MEDIEILKRLQSEWCSELNRESFPKAINLKDNKHSYYWKCFNNHIVKTSIKTRALSTCRICKKIENSITLEDSINNISEYYNYTLNSPLLPINININSHEHVYITCPDCDLTKLMEVRKFKNYKNKLYSCSYCSGKIFNEDANSLEKVFPEYLEYFDYKKNTLKTNEINVKSKSKIYWRCNNNSEHSFKLTVAEYTKNNNCRICEELKLIEVTNNFKDAWTEVVNYWDYEKNIGTPEGYKSKSNYLAAFNCPNCYNAFNNYIFRQIITKDCPYCANRRIIKGFNDISIRLPELKEYWDFEKNILSIYEARVTDKIWFKCLKNHSYQRVIFDIKDNVSKSCQKCYVHGVSRMEKELLEFIESINKGEVISNDKIILNGKELDIYLPELRIAFEFNGDFWHSDEWLLKSQAVTARKHHSNKLKLAKNAEVSLYFVWERDWLRNRIVVEQAIISLLENKVSSPLLLQLE